MMRRDAEREVSVHPEEQASLGPAAFLALRAEEEPWLPECFVPPPNFDRISDPRRSVVLFGDPGSGKTAVHRMLETISLGTDGKPFRLLVHWKPALPISVAEAGLDWVKAMVGHILDACADALIHHLACYPQDYQKAPPWAQARFVWFIHRYTRGNPMLRWGPLVEGDSPGAPLVRQILSGPVDDILYADAPPEYVISELVSALKALEMDGIWILTDGLEGWAEMAFDRLCAGLKAFLSTLSLFDPFGLIYKICLPSELEPALSHAGGLARARRRVEGIHIRWDSPTLRRLVERRLSLAFGREPFPLEELCTAAGLPEWLEKVGGTSPREWLDQVAGLVEYYTTHSRNRPIDEDIWKRLRLQRPPRLYLDDERRRVIVGGRCVNLEDLPAKAYEMLRYLYQRSGAVVTKAELYFRIYRGLDRIPRPGDKEYEAPKEYTGLIDTNLWRLRQAIEPDPSAPVLLVTRRGHGVVLQARW
jgi:hypothetical protein